MVAAGSRTGCDKPALRCHSLGMDEFVDGSAYEKKHSLSLSLGRTKKVKVITI